MDKKIRGAGEGDGVGDRPAKRTRGSMMGLSSNPMAIRNLYAEQHRGNTHGTVVDSPNGPVSYKNPNHPWLSPKQRPDLTPKGIRLVSK